MVDGDSVVVCYPVTSAPAPACPASEKDLQHVVSAVPISRTWNCRLGSLASFSLKCFLSLLLRMTNLLFKWCLVLFSFILPPVAVLTCIFLVVPSLASGSLLSFLLIHLHFKEHIPCQV